MPSSPHQLKGHLGDRNAGMVLDRPTQPLAQMIAEETVPPRGTRISGTTTVRMISGLWAWSAAR